MSKLMMLIEPGRLLYLVLGSAAFAYFAHLLVACGVAIFDGSFFGAGDSLLAVVFTGGLPYRDSASENIREGIECVLLRGIHFTFLSTAVPGALLARYIVDQWWGSQFWFCCVVVAAILLVEVLIVTAVSCGNRHAPRFWPSGESWPADSEELARDVRKAESDARSWNLSRMRLFGIIAACDLFAVALAALLLNAAAA